MKKVMFLLAVAGMFAFAACNNEPKTDEQPAPETTEIQEPVQDENADSTNMEEGTPAEGEQQVTDQQ